MAVDGSIRVVVAHAHPVVRLGTCRVLEEASDLTVVAAVVDGPDVLRVVRETDPDVVVTGTVVPKRSRSGGSEGAWKGNLGAAAVLVLSSHASRASVMAMRQAGADGYVTTRATPEQIAEAVRGVARGGSWLGPRAAAALARASPGEAEALTSRELEVLYLLADGFSNREIAEELCVSKSTVKTHLRNLRRKLGARNRTHAVARAYERELLPGE